MRPLLDGGTRLGNYLQGICSGKCIVTCCLKECFLRLIGRYLQKETLAHRAVEQDD